MVGTEACHDHDGVVGDDHAMFDLRPSRPSQPGGGPDDPYDEATELHRLWTHLGIPGPVDLHTHFMPPQVLEKVWAYFDRAGPLLGRPWPVFYRAPEERRVAQLRTFGVVAFTSLCYAHKPGMARWLNEWTADFAARTPGCIHSATFFPEPEAGRYVSEALAVGARVFKAHVQVGGYDPNDSLLDHVWGLLTDSQVPVVLHGGSGPVAGRHTGAAVVRRLLSRYPELHLIVAHMGLPEYREFLDIAADHDSVYLDTTMAFTDFTEATDPFPPSLRGRLGELSSKIVFGSDFPNIPYTYRHAVESLVGLDLGDEWLRGVLFGNGARLFGLSMS